MTIDPIDGGGGVEAIRRRLEAAVPVAGFADAAPPPDPRDDPDEQRPNDLDRWCANLSRNDYSNGQRLVARHAQDLLFVPELGWAAWVGSHWSFEEGDRRARIAAHHTALSMAHEAQAVRDAGPQDGEPAGAFEERLADTWKWSISSGNSARITGMLNEARPYVERGVDELDSDLRVFNVRNGTLLLHPDARVELVRHDRQRLITKIAPVHYHPQAACPVWRRFLAGVLPDPDVQGFMQRYAGYCLTGLITEQVMALLYGTGANGKSTFVETLTYVLGDYGKTIGFASLLHDERRRGGEASPDIARLPGARLVLSSEPDEGARFSESLLKSLTGGDTLTARQLHAKFFEFVPQFKLMLSFNSKPRITGTDHGIWRRLLLIPWEVTIPAGQRDPGLPEKLRQEAPGILNWILDGYRLWAERGLDVPERVRAASREYREEMDPLAGFLTACILSLPGARVRTQRAYAVYSRWCKENAIEPMSGNMFTRRMKQKGYRDEKIGHTFFLDIAIHPDWEQDDTPPDRTGDE